MIFRVSPMAAGYTPEIGCGGRRTSKHSRRQKGSSWPHLGNTTAVGAAIFGSRGWAIQSMQHHCAIRAARLVVSPGYRPSRDNQNGTCGSSSSSSATSATRPTANELFGSPPAHKKRRIYEDVEVAVALLEVELFGSPLPEEVV